MKYRVDFVTNSSSSSSVVLMFMNKNEIVSSISYEIGIPTESLKEYKSSYSRVLQYIILTKQLSIFTKNEDLLRDYVEVSGIDVVQIYKSYEDLKGIKSAHKTVELLDQINTLELMSASLAVNTFSEFESHEIWNFLGINPISVDSLKEEYRLSTDDDEYYDKTKLNIKRIGNEENKKRKLPVTTKSSLVLSGSEDQMILQVSKKPHLFKELPEEMRESEFVKKSITNLNPMSIIYMTNVSEDLYLEALSKDISVFEKLNEELKINEEFLLKAIKVNEDVYDFIKNTIKTKKKFVLNAVSINGKVLGLLDLKFRQNANIVLAALRNNVNSCEYIGAELLEDSKFRKEFDVIAFEHGIKLRKPKVIYDYKVGDVKPRNNGRKWEEEDLKYLINNYKKGIELDTIAFELGRGTLGCILKLESNNADTITNLDKLVAKFSKDVIAYVDSNHLIKTTTKPLIEKSEKVIVEKPKTTKPNAKEADIKKEVKKHKKPSSYVKPIKKEKNIIISDEQKLVDLNLRDDPSDITSKIGGFDVSVLNEIRNKYKPDYLYTFTCILKNISNNEESKDIFYGNNLIELIKKGFDVKHDESIFGVIQYSKDISAYKLMQYFGARIDVNKIIDSDPSAIKPFILDEYWDYFKQAINNPKHYSNSIFEIRDLNTLMFMHSKGFNASDINYLSDLENPEDLFIFNSILYYWRFKTDKDKEIVNFLINECNYDLKREVEINVKELKVRLIFPLWFMYFSKSIHAQCTEEYSLYSSGFISDFFGMFNELNMNMTNSKGQNLFFCLLVLTKSRVLFGTIKFMENGLNPLIKDNDGVSFLDFLKNWPEKYAKVIQYIEEQVVLKNLNQKQMTYATDDKATKTSIWSKLFKGK